MTGTDIRQAVVIGASAGALEALSAILPCLPQDYPLPIFVVVHLPPDKKSVLADLFQSKCAMIVKEAEDKEEIKAGTVYFAAPDYHLQIEPDGRTISLSDDEPVLFSRPSIDVLFETAADAYGDGVIGIILSGANSDGAHGLRMIEKAGGTVFVQTPGLAYASAMPEASIKACPSAIILAAEDIAQAIEKAVWS